MLRGGGGAERRAAVRGGVRTSDRGGPRPTSSVYGQIVIPRKHNLPVNRGGRVMWRGRGAVLAGARERVRGRAMHPWLLRVSIVDHASNQRDRPSGAACPGIASVSPTRITATTPACAVGEADIAMPRSGNTVFAPTPLPTRGRRCHSSCQALGISAAARRSLTRIRCGRQA